MISLQDHPEEELAFYNHDSNRAVGVVWPAIVENRLTDLLKTFMRPDERVWKELFRPEGALGTFGQKIRLGYMLGLYREDFKNDLILLARIRNKFAHEVEIDSFETPPIRDYMDKMHVLKVNRDLLERMKKGNPQEDPRKTTLFILSSELCDYRDSFHLCIRDMIHLLVGAHIKVKQQQSVRDASTASPADRPE